MSAGEAELLSHELEAPPWRRVESTLMSAAQSIRVAYDTRLAPLGLTLSLASLLAYIAEVGSVNQSHCAKHLAQGRAATGAQVDRLEQLGYIQRAPHPEDRRVWMLEITPAGTRKAADVADVDAILREQLRAGITRPERQQLAALLLRLQDNVATALGNDSTSPTNSTEDQQ